MPEDFQPTPAAESLEARLDEEALHWVVRIHSGPVLESLQAECDAWRMQSPAHERAYRAAESLWQDVGHAHLRVPISAERTFQRVPGRTSWAVAACLLLIIGASFTEPLREWINEVTADYQSGVGQQRMVSLQDGSTIQLNTDTAINVAFSNSRRGIHLLKGEAAFTIATDPHRPFTVQSGSIQTRALGTVFSVRHQKDMTTVTVIEHSVQVNVASAASPLVVHEGEQLSYSLQQGASTVRRVDLERETAWQRGKLIFESKPLTEVVAELNRYRHGRIVILNPALRPVHVTGLFDMADPDGALRMIHRTLSIHETNLSPYLVLLH